MSTHLIGWHGAPLNETYMIRVVPVFHTVSTVFREEPEELYWLGRKQISRSEFELLSINKMPGRNLITCDPADVMLVANQESPKPFWRPEAHWVSSIRFSLYLSEEDAKEVIEKIASDVISEGANPQATQVISALKG